MKKDIKILEAINETVRNYEEKHNKPISHEKVYRIMNAYYGGINKILLEPDRTKAISIKMDFMGKLIFSEVFAKKGSSMREIYQKLKQRDATNSNRF